MCIGVPEVGSARVSFATHTLPGGEIGDDVEMGLPVEAGQGVRATTGPHQAACLLPPHRTQSEENDIE